MRVLICSKHHTKTPYYEWPCRKCVEEARVFATDEVAKSIRRQMPITLITLIHQDRLNLLFRKSLKDLSENWTFGDAPDVNKEISIPVFGGVPVLPKEERDEIPPWETKI
jgi:hypothetical protein